MAHSPSVKAAAIAMLLLGSGVRETAATLHLPLSTVSRWHVEEVKPRQRAIAKRLGLRQFDFAPKRDTQSQNEVQP